MATTKSNSKTQAEKTVNDGYRLALKVSKKGAVQLNGLRRFPVTLYADEWKAIFDRVDSIKSFIDKNKNNLKAKAEAGDDADAMAI
jgi:hypothetical protein